MIDIAEFRKEIFNAGTNEFQRLALQLYGFQARENQVYNEFLQILDIDQQAVNGIEGIPFLPVELFKTRKIVSGNLDVELFFESSGTSGQQTSKHFVYDTEIYKTSIVKTFEAAFGPTEHYCLLFLFPSYLERKHASLVYMCETLMQNGCKAGSGFYLNEQEKLHDQLLNNESNHIPTLLMGVSFALLDFAEKFPMQLNHTILMETGGMKGRRAELTREELHTILKEAFQLPVVHSEYGMTELFSMAYSKENGKFFTPPWMKILIRDPEDPFTILKTGKTGCINVIDLANIYSCAFIATQDLGKLNPDGSFEVLGRYDNSDIRGCNLIMNDE